MALPRLRAASAGPGRGAPGSVVFRDDSRHRRADSQGAASEQDIHLQSLRGQSVVASFQPEPSTPFQTLQVPPMVDGRAPLPVVDAIKTLAPIGKAPDESCRHARATRGIGA